MPPFPVYGRLTYVRLDLSRGDTGGAVARILGLMLLLMFSGLVSAQGITRAQALAMCESAGQNKLGNYGYWTVISYECLERAGVRLWDLYQEAQGGAGEILAEHTGLTFEWNVDHVCEAGQSETGLYKMQAPEHRPGGKMCLDGCEYDISSDAEEVIQYSGSSGFGFYRLKAKITNTGAQCNVGGSGGSGSGSGGPEPPVFVPDPGDCEDIGGGWKHCGSDPMRCVRDPDGKRLCPSQPGPDCRITPDHAACSRRDPPEDYDDPDPPIVITYYSQRSSGGSDITMASKSDDDDDEEDEDDDSDCPPNDPDCEDDDEDEDDRPDCPPNDPDCEDDDDDDSPRAGDAGCQTETPPCSDMGHVECQILLRTHRTNCTVHEGNEILDDFREKNLAEIRETNAKLKALKETLIENNLSVLDVLENKLLAEVAVTNEKIRDLQSNAHDIHEVSKEIRDGIDDGSDQVASSVNTARDLLATKLDTATDTLGSKLDGINSTLESLDGGLGDNADVLSALGEGNATLSDILDSLGGTGSGSVDGPTDAEMGLGGEPESDDGDSWLDEGEIEIPDLDDSGFGWARSCPDAPSVNVFGRTITFDMVPVCNWLGIGSQLVLLFAALTSVRIIGRA